MTGDKAPEGTPRYDGDTYVTSKRAKTGVGNEPAPIDLRETAEKDATKG